MDLSWHFLIMTLGLKGAWVTLLWKNTAMKATLLVPRLWKGDMQACFKALPKGKGEADSTAFSFFLALPGQVCANHSDSPRAGIQPEKILWSQPESYWTIFVTDWEVFYGKAISRRPKRPIDADCTKQHFSLLVISNCDFDRTNWQANKRHILHGTSLRIFKYLLPQVRPPAQQRFKSLIM